MTAFIINPDEARIIRWALGAMEDFWGPGGDAEREGMKGGLLPKIEGSMLFLSDSDEVNSDLRYRVGVQWRDMTEQGPDPKKKQAADLAASHLLECKLTGSGVPDWLEVKERHAG
jgi:hypothetical protein